MLSRVIRLPFNKKIRIDLLQLVGRFSRYTDTSLDHQAGQLLVFKQNKLAGHHSRKHFDANADQGIQFFSTQSKSSDSELSQRTHLPVWTLCLTAPVD